MRIGLYISSMAQGGAERALARLSDLFYDKGNEVYVIISDPMGSKYPLSGKILYLDLPSTTSKVKKIIRIFQRVKKLIQIKKKYKLDVVISYLNGANFINSFAKVKNTKSILTVHNFTSVESRLIKRSKIELFFLKQAYKRADLVLGVSESLTNDLREMFKIKKNIFKTWYNFIDIETIKMNSGNDSLIEMQEFKEKHSLVFSTIGRLEYAKGFWHQLKIIKSLRDKGENIGCFIVGEGSHRSKIEEYIKRNNLEDHIILLGSKENPFKYIKYSDLHFTTSVYEGFQIVLVEAMSIGLPVIASNCLAGPSEILSNRREYKVNDRILKEEFGILLPPMSEKEDFSDDIDGYETILNDLISIINNKDLLEYYSKQSIKRAVTFSKENAYNVLMDMIKEIKE